MDADKIVNVNGATIYRFNAEKSKYDNADIEVEVGLDNSWCNKCGRDDLAEFYLKMDSSELEYMPVSICSNCIEEIQTFVKKNHK